MIQHLSHESVCESNLAVEEEEEEEEEECSTVCCDRIYFFPRFDKKSRGSGGHTLFVFTFTHFI